MRGANKKRVVLFAVLTAVWCAVIWGHSLLSGEDSSVESSAVKDFLTPLFELFVGKGNVTVHLVRKVAHFSEFFVLGLLSVSLLRSAKKDTLFYLSYALFCGVTVAVADETIQLFSPGRGPSVKDVLIDCAGLLCGIVLLRALLALTDAVRKKKLRS